jgi:hypothetical protein
MYYMNRLSGETWEKEQSNDGPGTTPIRINDIENGVKCATVQQLLANEHGRHNPNAVHDIELCSIIDRMLEDRFEGKTIYQLSLNQVQQAATFLRATYHIGTEQIRRCLAMSRYPAL